MDAKLKWKEPVKIKTEQLQIKYGNMYWLIRRYSPLSTKTVLVYRQVLNSAGPSDLKLWGCSRKRYYNYCLTSIKN